MQQIALLPCLFLALGLLLALSILGHELGHALAMIHLHQHGKPIVICLGCKLTRNAQAGTYQRPVSSWIIRGPRLLLIVAPSTRALSFGITYGQEQLSKPQRCWMLLAGPLATLVIWLGWSAGAWWLFHSLTLPQAWTPWDLLMRLDGAFLCGIVAVYNGCFFLLSILPIPNQSSTPLSSHTGLVPASGSDGYQLMRLWQEGRSKKNTSHSKEINV